MAKRLHHLNFIVRDLEAVAARFAALLEEPRWAIEHLPARGVRLVRFDVGGAWLVLVEPTDPQGAPAQILEQRGEGFMLAAFEVEDLSAAVDELEGRGVATRRGPSREGLDAWRVQDLDPGAFHGICLQLVEARD